MNNHDPIEEIKETYAEWFEMSSNPQELLLCILASKLIGHREYAEYLKKRLEQFEKEKQ